jgi:hypothetical protein
MILCPVCGTVPGWETPYSTTSCRCKRFSVRSVSRAGVRFVFEFRGSDVFTDLELSPTGSLYATLPGRMSVLLRVDKEERIREAVDLEIVSTVLDS